MRVWFLLCVVLLAGCASRTRNLVPGGDFEPTSEFEGVPAGWSGTSVPRTADYVEFSWDREVSRDGDRSISISISEDHPDDPIAYNWTRTIRGWKVGETYELKAFVRARNLKEAAWIVVQCWNLEYEELVGFASTQSDHPVRGTTDWVRVGQVFEIPVGTEEIRIRAGIAAPDNRGGQVWFDGIEIRRSR